MKRKTPQTRQKRLRGSTPKMKDSLVLYSSNAAITTVPTQKFMDWIISTGTRGKDFGWYDLESRAYLVPDCNGLDGCEDWVLENAQQIFEEELREYDPKGRHWPPVRNSDTIWEYFSFVYYSRVIHLRRNNCLN